MPPFLVWIFAAPIVIVARIMLYALALGAVLAVLDGIKLLFIGIV